ncbi:MAG: UTP--glucose-1-phosphate uridylyltransferase [Candidatus Saccharimonadales bacterium]
MKKPTKAIIAAAGLGTRFLPQTKAMPKEMLPIIDKPVIQIIVEQLVASGVTDVIIVTGSTKRAIEDHFDRSDELENELRAKGKEELADEIKQIAELANFVYLRQKGNPKGNARPLLNASHLLSDDEPFYMFFADDFFRSDVPHAKQLLEVYERTGNSVISLIEVEPKDTSKYGIADIADKLDDRTFNVSQLVEKPGPEKAPSNFAAVGGYLLTPDILPIVAQENVGHGGEIVLADSINELAKQGKVDGRFIEGVYHDAGDKMRYLRAIVDHALADPKLGPNFKEYIKTRLNQ